MSAFNIENYKEKIEAYVQAVNDAYDPQNGDVYPDMSEFVADVASHLNILHLILDDAFDETWNAIADVIFPHLLPRKIYKEQKNTAS